MQVREIQGNIFWETIEEVKKSEKNVLVCFYGDRQENGESWCPDCAKGENISELFIRLIFALVIYHKAGYLLLYTIHLFNAHHT